MEKQYFEYKKVLTEILTALGFTTQPEDTTGLGRSIAFVKEDLRLSLVFDLRDQMLFLQSKKDNKSAGHATIYSKDSMKDFEQKVNGILTPQGFEIEVPAKYAKTGGFLSKLVGKK
jgi:hypothetical protein